MSNSSEKSPEHRRKAAEELVRGRELARQLDQVLKNVLDEANDFSSHTTQDLVMKILNSFSKSLSILNSSNSDEFSTQIQLGEAEKYGREICIKDSMLKKDRRGSYKRKQTSHSRTMESSSLVDDGYTWRKYGQKVILKAKYHRNYFRCSRKYDEGCLATKQVQRIEEDPPKFRTIYHGDHTCRNLYETPTDVAGLSEFSVSDYLVPQDHPTAIHGEFQQQLVDEGIDMMIGGDRDEISEVMVESYINFKDDDEAIKKFAF